MRSECPGAGLPWDPPRVLLGPFLRPGMPWGRGLLFPLLRPLLARGTPQAESPQSAGGCRASPDPEVSEELWGC